MKLKKFRAADMAEAMRVIKAELGPDAVIMSSRQVKKRKGFLGLFSKKELEVLAGYEEAEEFTPQMRAAQAAISNVQAAAEQRALQGPSNEKLEQGLDELRGMVERLGERIASAPEQTPDRHLSRDVLEIYHRMVGRDVEEATAQAICSKAEDIVITRDADAEDVVRNIVLDSLGKPHFIEPVKYQRKAVMLVGPTGVGKTTTLIKLAYMLIYQKNVNIGIINTDSFRVAAQEHMKSYCDIMHTDMLTVYKPEEIGDALDAFRNKDVVLIDTAGKVSDDDEYRQEIAKLVEMGHIDEVYITLSASTSERVLERIVNNYSFLKHYNIIVTKTDEASGAGILLYLARLSGKPLSYITTGQTVPDDLAEVNPERIADQLLVRA